MLASATDLGFTNFHTAPAYGDGLGPAKLGRFTRGRRSRLVIATEYGIAADPLVEACPSLALPLRGARAIARKAGFRHRPLPLFTATGLRESVERSLRRLSTDYVDFLFLHQPGAERMPSLGDVLNESRKLQQRGVIRAFGLTGASRAIDDLLVGRAGVRGGRPDGRGGLAALV